MPVLVDLDPEVERALISHAQERGLSLNALVQEVLGERLKELREEPTATTACLELPSLHLGVIGSLRRTEIYDDSR